MLRIHLLWISLLGFHLLSAQSIDRQVISTLGFSTSQMSATIGEPVTATFISGSFTLSQGFQQGEKLPTVGIKDQLQTLVTYTLYPNPAREQLTLELNSDQWLQLQLQVIDLRGKVVLAGQDIQVSGFTSQQLNVSRLAAGTYLLRLSTQDGVPLHNIRFVRQP